MWKKLWEDLIKRPLFLCTVFLVLGTISGKMFPDSFPVITALILMFLIIITVVFLLRIFYVSGKVTYLTVALALFFLLGFLNFHRAVYLPGDNVKYYTGSEVVLEGIVWEDPFFENNHLVFDLKALAVHTSSGRETISGKVRVLIYEKGEFDYGDLVTLRGELKNPPERRNPGGFDYRFHLLTRDVSALMQVRDFNHTELLSSGEGIRLISQSLAIKNNILELIHEKLSYREAALLEGILLGTRERIPPQVEESFRRAGIGHLLAVSGLHIGLIVSFFLVLFKILKIKREFTWPLILIFIFVYLVVIGFKPSAVRASLMLLIGAGAFLFKREKDALTAAAASAFIILLIKPLWLFTISFQLSFGSVLSIILLAPFLEKSLEFMPLILQKIISVTLAAQLGVLPLTAYYFFEMSLVSLLTNIMVLPIMAVIVGLGFSGSLAGLIFNYLGIILFNINSIFLTYLIYLAEFLSNLPGAYLKVNPPSVYFLLAYYFFIFLLLPGEDFLRWVKELKFKLNINSFKKKNSASIIMVMVLAAFMLWVPAFKSRPFLRAVFLDVGQGDSTFIRTSSNLNILIDAGGRPAYLLEEEYGPDFIGERVVVPFLRHQGIKKLDLVILSHPHEDHYSGLIPVIENFPVDLMVTSRAVSNFPLYRRLMEMIQEKGIPLLYLEAGDKITLGSELTLEFYNPPERLFTGTISDLNNNSLVFRLKAGEASFLFSGDAEYPAERHMLSSNFEMGSQVLKVGHHGAYSSIGESLLELVDPDIAVVQVGINSFGHPSPVTLELLEKRGIYVCRTDRDGAVTVTTDGKIFWVKTFLPHLD